MSRKYGYNPNQSQAQQANPQTNSYLANPYLGGNVQVHRVVIYDVTGRPVEDKTMAPVNLQVGDTLTVNWTCPAPGNAHIAQPQSHLP